MAIQKIINIHEHLCKYKKNTFGVDKIIYSDKGNHNYISPMHPLIGRDLAGGKLGQEWRFVNKPFPRPARVERLIHEGRPAPTTPQLHPERFSNKAVRLPMRRVVLPSAEVVWFSTRPKQPVVSGSLTDL